MLQKMFQKMLQKMFQKMLQTHFPMRLNPIGISFLSLPVGTEMAGIPTKFANFVNWA